MASSAVVGQLVAGVVVRVTQGGVLVDCGLAQPGFVPTSELALDQSVSPAHVTRVGQRIDAVVLRDDPSRGPLLSKTRADAERNWPRIEAARANLDTVRGTVVAVNNGGLILDVFGIRSFMPASLIEAQHVDDLHRYRGRVLDARVIDTDKSRHNVVLNHRVLAEEAAAAARQKRLDALLPGADVSVRVSRLTDAGAVVDLDGLEEFIPTRELTWSHVPRPHGFVRPGERLDARVMAVDPHSGRVSLSARVRQPDPWISYANSHEVGDLVHGRVTKQTTFGSFVQLADGVDGLVHVSEYDGRDDAEPRLDEQLWVKIVSVDRDRHRIALSIRQVRSGGRVQGDVRTHGPALTLANGRSWRRTGIDPADWRSWLDLGWSPEDADEWARGGFPANDAQGWHAAGFLPAEARKWRDAGFQPADGEAWLGLGVQPTVAAEWVEYFTDAPDAAPWIEAGMDPRDASAWARAGHRPRDATPWHNSGLQLTEALAWTSANIAPDEAGVWTRSGFGAVEALEWRAHGWSASAAQEWFAAGITADVARRWSALGVAVPLAASAPFSKAAPEAVEAWLAAGWEIDATSEWLPTGLNPEEAHLWRQAGFAADAAGLWSAHFGVEEATAWRDVRATVDQAHTWTRAGVPPAEARKWIRARFDASEANNWSGRDFSTSSASSWRALGFEAADAELWRDAGWRREEAADWYRERFTPSSATAWRDASFSAADASKWRALKASPATAAEWRGARFTPNTAPPWREAGWAATEAGRWRRTGWTPDEASSWRGAGWEEPKLAAAWREVRVDANVALRAHVAGLTPDLLRRNGLAAPVGFDPAANSAGRPTSQDELFGSPRSESDIRKWITSATGSPPVGGRASLAPNEVVEALLWAAPRRLGAADVVRLQARLGCQLGSAGWEQRAWVVLTSAMPLLVPPSEANAKINGEPPPEDLLPDLRLPFERVAVVFGARFELTDRMRELVPSWDRAARRCLDLSFEPWLTHMRERGGAVTGVVLIAGSDGAGLSDSVLWLADVDGQHFVVPGRRSKSVLNPMLENIAAGVCWGGWSRDLAEPPTIRRAASRGRLDAGAPHDVASTVHEVRIHARRNDRYSTSEAAGAGRTPHVRRGHWRRSRVGPRDDWHYEWRWIDATYVGGAPPPDSPRTVYRLPEWILDWTWE